MPVVTDRTFVKTARVRPLVDLPPDIVGPEGPVLLERPPREPRMWVAARLAVALPLLALSLSASFPFTLVPVSSQAVVNARLSEVRAPMQGSLNDLHIETGDVVKANDPMVEVVAQNAPLPTDAAGREKMAADLNARSIEIHGQIEANERKASRFTLAAESYTGHLASDLEAQLRAASAEADQSKSRVTTLADEVKRDQQAVNEHLMPRPVLDEAQEKLDEATRAAQVKADAVSRLKAQLVDVRSGYLLDRNSQAPVSIEQRDQAEAEADQLRAEKRAVEEQLKALQAGQSPQSTTPRTVELRSPVTGPVWARSASPWQNVERGDALFRVADESSIHVEVWLDRRYGPELSIGDTALVYLSGMSTELTGKIVSFQGTSRRRLDEEVNAIDLQPVHPDQYHVTIELDPSDRKSRYIGQAAKVLFPGSKDQFRSRFYSLLMRF